MCGLFGAYSTLLNKTEIEHVTDLGIVSSLRGFDSTGIIVVGRKKNKHKYHHRKAVEHASVFLMKEETQRVMNQNPLLIAGHCRWATHGTINERNAHPIHCKHIMGMHNGTIDRFKPEKGKEDDTSDSRILFEKIAEKGLEAALKEAGPAGAWAIVYVDLDKGTLNFVRNNKRPLWFMTNREENTIYWASERAFLDLIERRSFLLFKTPYELKEDTLITFNLGKLDPKVTKLDLSEPSYWQKTKEATKEVATNLLGMPICSSCKRLEYYCNCPVDPPWKDKGTDNACELQLFKGYEGVIYTVPTIKKYLAEGCVNCGTVCAPEVATHWIDHSLYVCGECLDHQFVREYIVPGKVSVYRGELYDKPVEGRC